LGHRKAFNVAMCVGQVKGMGEDLDGHRFHSVQQVIGLREVAQLPLEPEVNVAEVSWSGGLCPQALKVLAPCET
jgi:hypothetical protein